MTLRMTPASAYGDLRISGMVYRPMQAQEGQGVHGLHVYGQRVPYQTAKAALLDNVRAFYKEDGWRLAQRRKKPFPSERNPVPKGPDLTFVFENNQYQEPEPTLEELADQGRSAPLLPDRSSTRDSKVLFYDRTAFNVKQGLYKYAPGEDGEEPQFTLLFAAPSIVTNIFRSFVEREAFLAYLDDPS